MGMSAPRSPDRAETVFKRLGSLPVACAVSTAINGLYILLVGIGNVTDYGTNFAFVQHVLAMDTTNFGAAQGTALDTDVMWRAINSPVLQTAAYVAIIIWECATAAVLLVATGQWLRALRSNSFDMPRRWSSIGLTMIVILFMGGFIAIGGEWFQMWRSTEWNGIDAAFRSAVLALFGLVMVHLPSSACDTAAVPTTQEMTARDQV